MNRFLVLLLLTILFISLPLKSQNIIYTPIIESYELSWEKPDITNQTYQSILYEHSEEFRIINAVNDSSYFALRNISTFKNAVIKLFTEKRNDSSFFFRKKAIPQLF